ncbi:uncharacterized protein [Rutidosis leptorrhynchoides]|uniref:uncharacterized protein isoform X3 n=1 Tax=Rutidosis leptorrhynchoides TaxID=125765 RepID=UPI003A99F54F
MRTYQTARGSGMKLEYQVMDAGSKLINVSSSSSSTPDILNVLLEIEKVLISVQQSSEAMIKALNPINQALIANGLMRHPDMNVNISVVCCICEIIRIMAPDAPYDHQHMKEFFEALVTSFEKQSLTCGGYYGKMTRALGIFSKSRLPVMMLDLQLEELVCRLFKQFLIFANFNNTSTVLKMEKIMTMIIEESGEALALEALIITTLEKVNKIASPICLQLGEKVLKNCAAKLSPHLQNMEQDEAKETIPCTSDTSKLMNDKIDTVKLKSLEENNNMEQTLSDCQDLTRDKVIHSDDEKNDVSLTSNCVKEVNGKPKRNDQQSCRATKKMRTKQTKGSGIKLVMDAGNKLINVSSSTPDILNVLSEVEKVLSRVQQSSKAMIKALHPIIQALIAEPLLRHPDMNVNISVVCCICEIIRFMAPDAPPYDHQHMKEFFEALVTSIEKQSSTCGGYYGRMTRVLLIFSKSRLPVMMLDLQLEELVGRLFKQFLTFDDFNDSYTVLKMEKIMTMIIEESEKALELEALIITTLEKIASPSCWRLGKKVLKKCAAKLRPHLPDMAQDVSIAFEAKETIPCTSDTSKLMNDKIDTVKLESPEENVNVEPTLSNCQDLTRDTVIHSDDEKNGVAFSNCVTGVNGKRKRNDQQQKVPKKVLYSMAIVHGYKIKKSNAPILEAIFKKHGDIASNCVVKASCVRESVLDIVCEVVKRIQTNDFATIISDMEDIEMQMLDAEAINMNVVWLRTHLEAFHKKNASQRQSTLLVEMKANTRLVKRAAKMDLEETRIELATAQEKFKKAERCVEVLDLVETKLNDKFLESEGEKDLWLKDSVL